MEVAEQGKVVSLGGHVVRYLRHRTDLSDRAFLDYEKTLHRFVVEHHPSVLADFEPPEGSERIEEWLARNWGQSRPGTMLKMIAALGGFFNWAHERGRIERNPMPLVNRPRRHSTPRSAHAIAEVIQVINAQPLARDRVALRLLGQLGLRKNELRLLRIRDFDLDRPSGSVRLQQKGGDTVDHRLYFPDLLEALREHFTSDYRGADEYLIYPRWERKLNDGTIVIQREERGRPLSPRGLHEWWVRCLDRVDVEHFPMHELRHTAGTEFYRATRDMELTRQFMRHRSIMTTSAIYLHLDHQDMDEALEKVAARWAA